MKSSTALKVVSIYCLVLGVLAIIGNLGDPDAEPAIYLVCLVFFVFGLLALVISSRKTQMVMMLILFIINAVFIGFAAINLFIIPEISMIIFVGYGVPFAFGIVYFVKFKKEGGYNPGYIPYQNMYKSPSNP